jgi:MATE family multidrug resistance protein
MIVGAFLFKYPMAITRDQLKNVTLISLPIIAGQLSHMIASFADRVMLGQYSTLSLASFGLVNNIHAPVLMVFIGVAMGITPVVGRMNGAGERDELPMVYKTGFKVTAMTAAYSIAIMLAIYFWLDEIGAAMDYDLTVINESKHYFLYVIGSFVPYTFFLSTKQFQEGLGIVKPMMLGSIAGNATNIVLNYLFIYGKMGIPEMGTDGAGLATFLGRMVMMGVALYTISIFPMDRGGLKGNWERRGSKHGARYFKRILSIGGPIGFQFAMEAGAFAAGAFIIFKLGSIPLAAHEIAIGLAAFTFMTASGIGQGATVVISNAIGAGLKDKMRNAADSSFVISIGFMSLTAIFFILTREWLPLIFNTDPNVISMASSLLLIAGFFQIADGLQLNAMGVLRGMEDVKFASYVTILGYWVLAIPLGYMMTLHWGVGPAGVWYGYLIGLSVVGVILFFRYKKMAERVV